MKIKNEHWIIGILLSIIIGLIVIKVGNNDKIVDYIGFAATLASLLLAILAIIYSYYQNSTYSGATEKLNESAEVIKNLTEDIKMEQKI